MFTLENRFPKSHLKPENMGVLKARDLRPLPSPKDVFSPLQNSFQDAIHFSGRPLLDSKPLIEEAMALLANAHEEKDRVTFCQNILLALDPTSEMPKDKRLVYRKFIYGYGKALGLKNAEILSLEEIQRAFFNRARSVYKNAFFGVMKKNPKDFKAFADAMRWSHGDNLFFYADKNGLGSSKSALGKIVSQIYNDEYSYSNGFFGYPSLHSAFLGVSPENLFANMYEDLAGDLVPPQSLTLDFIKSKVMDPVGLLKPIKPKMPLPTAFLAFEPKAKEKSQGNETDWIQTQLENPNLDAHTRELFLEMAERKNNQSHIIKHLQDLYPRLFEGIDVKQLQFDGFGSDDAWRTQQTKQAALKDLVQTLSRHAARPKTYYELDAEKIMEHLFNATRSAVYERDYALKNPTLPVEAVKLPSLSLLKETLLAPRLSENDLSVEAFIQYKGHLNQESNRFDILNHLFFVIGNGYDWVNGRLVASESPNSRDIFYQNQKLSRQDFLKKLGEQDFIPNEALKAGKLPPKTQVKAYPISEYSRINTIPDDVQPEWLDLAREALSVVIRRDPKQQATAMKIYETLHHRFGERFPALPKVRD
jgi:hypothetical protein